jgi:hypothetical protein
MKLTKEEAKALWAGFTPEQRDEVKQMRQTGADAGVAIRAVATKAKDPAAYDVNAAPPAEFGDDVGSFIGSAGDVLSFGLADKALGAVRAGGRAVMTGDTSHLAEDFAAGQAQQREGQAAQEKFSPTASTLGKVAGVGAQMLMPAKLATAPSLGGAVMSGMGYGASTGALTGLGEDEGDVLSNIASGTALGALTGGVGGALARQIPRAVSAVKRLSSKDGIGALIKQTAMDAVEDTPIVGKIVKGARRIGKALDDAPAVADDVVVSADEAGAVLDDLADVPSLPLARPPPMPREAPAVKFLAPVDDVAEAAPAVVDDIDEVVRTRIVQEMPLAPSSLKRTAKEWATATDDEKIAALEEAAKSAMARFGSPDRAAVSSATGMPPGELDRLLPGVARRLTSTPAPPTTSPVAAKEAARAMPTLAPDEGRAAAQVAAANQGAELRAAYDAMPAQQRAGFVNALLQTMPPDMVRKRLGLTAAEWRRFSFDRVNPGASP